MLSSSVVERTYCPGCRGTAVTELYRRKFLEAPVYDYLQWYYKRNNIDFSFLGDTAYCINECSECGLLYQRYILSPEYMGIFYGEMMTLPGDTPLQYPLSHYKHIAAEVCNVISYFGGTRKLKVLDFGAGWGEWSLMAKAYGCDVYAAELSEDKLAYLRSCGVSTVSYDDLLKHEFDFINTEQVFEHIAAPGDMISHLGNALVSGGVLKVSLPNGERVKQNLKSPDFFAERLSAQSLMPLQPIEHINAFTEATLVKLAEQRNLFVTELDTHKGVKAIADHSVKELLIPVYEAIKNPFRPIFRKYFRRV